MIPSSPEETRCVHAPANGIRNIHSIVVLAPSAVQRTRNVLSGYYTVGIGGMQVTGWKFTAHPVSLRRRR